MPKLTKQLTLPCVNGADALKKLRKLMKRGCTDDHFNTDYGNLSDWNKEHAEKYSTTPCYLVVHECGQVLIVSHVGVGNMIKRVRDVEQHYVQD